MKKNDTLIDARELKKILLGESNFSQWIKEKIEKYNLKENRDYFKKEENVRATSELNMKKQNYFLTLDTCEKIIYSQKRSMNAEMLRRKLEKGEELEIIIKELLKPEEERIFRIELKDEEYPDRLRKIKNPPKQLYVKGSVQNLKEYGIAVIGTRHCSNYGRVVCKNFTNNLVGYNLNIISGLAIGIDACAHKACIEANGKTIAVLPSGFNNVFPKENEKLLNRILKKGGTVVTEYAPDFEKTSESCRERNRIISGLAIGTLVIEAQKVSGTTITVRNTNEQGKKSFCIPASILNSKGVGTNQMIKKCDAKLVTNVEDIIKEFPSFKLEKREDFNFFKIGETQKKKRKKDKSKINLKIQEENLEIYNVLVKGPKGIDEIAQVLNKPINEISYKLTLLELQGGIQELPGKKFKIK